MNRYMKFIAQVVATAVAAILPAFTGDDHISVSEWVNVGVLTLGAVGVLGAGNLPSGVWSYAKTYVSAATVGLVGFQSYMTGGVSTAEWFQIGVAVLGALGVGAVAGPVVAPVAREVPA